MRKIGSYPDRRAESFVDYLTAEGLAANAVKSSEGTYELWIVDEDHWEEAKQRFAKFEASPDDPQYAKAAKKARDIRREQREKKERVRQLVRVGEKNYQRRTPVTFICLGICVLLSLATEFSLNLERPIVQQMVFNFFPLGEAMDAGYGDLLQGNDGPITDGPIGLKAASILHGQFWRAISPAFLHADLRHLIFNMLVLISFGRRVEWMEGTWFMAGLVLVGAALPNLLQGLMPSSVDGSGVVLVQVADSLYFYVPFVGFSGVDFALVTFMWIRGVQRMIPEYQLSPLTVMIFLGVLFIGIAGGGPFIFGSKIANWGHGGGLVVGIIAALLPLGRTAKR